ncbi:MAG TPA: hypothetical protein VJ775_05930 [Sphingomicrobium sp.]|nr:hypothetical protein [Sphingomicrobium sp.]
MSEFAQVLFRSGKATPLMLARVRAKGARIGLSPGLQLTTDGRATDGFRDWWAKAFPTRTPLPREALHDREGRPSIAFHAVFR